MIKHLLESNALGNVDCEALADKIFGVISNLDVLWELESTSLNFFVGLLDFLRLKWWSTVQHSVENNSNTPNVDFVTMTTILEYFWSKIVGRSTNSTLLLTLVEDLGSKAKITNLECHILSKEEIAKFQITMDHFPRVDILNGTHKLMDVITSFDFVEALTALNHV